MTRSTKLGAVAALAGSLALVQAAPADWGISRLQAASIGNDFVIAESARLSAKYEAEEEQLRVKFTAGLLAKRELAPQPLHKRQGGGRTANVPLTCWYQTFDIGYTALASVGTPSQDFQLLPDTGSSDLWLNAPGSQNFDKSFDPSTSSSFTETARTLNISYNRGAFTGPIGSDTLTMGGLTLSNTTLAVGTVDRENFGRVGMEGLMGFAFQAISNARAPPFFTALAQQGLLAAPQASFFFNRGLEGSGGPGANTLQSASGGVLTLGGTDNTHYTGSIKTYPLLREQHWTIAMDGFMINDRLISGTAAPAAIDSGTSLIQVPNTLIRALAASFGGNANVLSNQLYVVCSALPSDWALSFSGDKYPIAMADLITDALTPQQAGLRSSIGNICGLAISGGQQAAEVNPSTGVRDSPLAVVGSAFLKTYYSVYTLPTSSSPSSVGFAFANPPSNATLQDVLNIKLGRTSTWPTGGANRGNGTGVDGSGDNRTGGGSGTTGTASSVHLPLAAAAFAAVGAMAMTVIA